MTSTTKNASTPANAQEPTQEPVKAEVVQAEPEVTCAAHLAEGISDAQRYALMKSGLSTAAWQAYALRAAGHTPQEIGKILHRDEQTVKRYVYLTALAAAMAGIESPEESPEGLPPAELASVHDGAEAALSKVMRVTKSAAPIIDLINAARISQSTALAAFKADPQLAAAFNQADEDGQREMLADYTTSSMDRKAKDKARTISEAQEAEKKKKKEADDAAAKKAQSEAEKAEQSKRAAQERIDAIGQAAAIMGNAPMSEGIGYVTVILTKWSKRAQDGMTLSITEATELAALGDLFAATLADLEACKVNPRKK